MSKFKARETIPYTKKMIYTPADRKKIKALKGGGEEMGTPNINQKRKQRVRKINKDLKTNIKKIKESPNFTGKNQNQRIQELKDTAKQDRKDVYGKYVESKKQLKQHGMMAPTGRGFDTIRKAGGGSLKDVSPDNVGLSKLPEGVRNRMGFKKYGGKITYKMTGGQVVDSSYD